VANGREEEEEEEEEERLEEEEEEEFFNHYKNDLKRHAHTPSGVAGADLVGPQCLRPGLKDPDPKSALLLWAGT